MPPTTTPTPDVGIEIYNTYLEIRRTRGEAAANNYWRNLSNEQRMAADRSSRSQNMQYLGTPLASPTMSPTPSATPTATLTSTPQLSVTQTPDQILGKTQYVGGMTGGASTTRKTPTTQKTPAPLNPPIPVNTPEPPSLYGQGTKASAYARSFLGNVLENIGQGVADAFASAYLGYIQGASPGMQEGGVPPHTYGLNEAGGFG